ncbi:MAG TPA: GAF domain-containing protein, partial [Acidimicrobiales bacterium]|nr:GAF domain-containing protein [Acidimicrobiales bacterium]
MPVEPLHDPVRLEALRGTGLLDPSPYPGFDRLTRLGARVMGVPIAAVVLVDDHCQYFKSHVGLDEALRGGRAVPLSHWLCHRVVGSGRSYVVHDVAAEFGLLDVRAMAELGARAYAGVPLLSRDGHALGAFSVIDTQPRSWSGDDVEILEELAGSVTTEIDRRLAAQRAEEAQTRLALLAEASTLLATLDSSEALEKLARLVVAGLADWCSILLVDEERTSISRVAVAHADPVRRPLMERLRDAYRADPVVPPGVAEVVRSGRAVRMADVGPADLGRMAHGPGGERLLCDLGFDSALVVPLPASGRTLGAMILGRHGDGEPRRYGPHDLDIAAELGRRAGLALDNARAYETQREIAGTLQRSLLPPALPRIRHFEVAATYKTPGDTVQVGGDFYDVFPLRGPGWGVAIGDVQGKGSAAAALTAMARYTVRAGALTLRNPRQVLAALNEAVIQQGERFLTMCLLTVQPSSDLLKARVCVAGHPLPFVLRGN